MTNRLLGVVLACVAATAFTAEGQNLPDANLKPNVERKAEQRARRQLTPPPAQDARPPQVAQPPAPDARPRPAAQFAAGLSTETIRRQLESGEPLRPEFEAPLTRYLQNSLLVPQKIDTRESALYGAAALLLRKGEVRQCLARLDSVLASEGEAQNDVVWLTRLNAANLCRFHVGDVQRAERDYKAVQGIWGVLAQRCLLDMLQETGKLNDPEAVMNAQLDAAQDAGERFAVMRRFAEFYARNSQDDRAIALYDRIADELKPEDAARMRADAAAYVEAQGEKAAQLQRDGDKAGVKRIGAELLARIAVLRAQGRNDEAAAMEGAIEKVKARLKDSTAPR